MLLLMEKNLQQDVKIPSFKKKTIVMKNRKLANKHKGKSQLVTFFDIMEFNADRIENNNMFLPSLLNMFSMFKIKYWYSLGVSEKNTPEKIVIRFSNWGE